MNIASLKVQNFKNYDELNLTFSDRLNCLVGLNGSGKTNLLDAIHYLAFTKSAFNSTDNQNIRHKEPFLRLEGVFLEGEKELKILCFLERGQKKVIRLNSKEYERLSDHIGTIQVILHTPYDTEIIRESSEARRKWVDGCISQYDHQYLENLLSYQRLIKQRNALLKKIEGRLSDSAVSLLDTYDEQVIDLSKKLSADRASFVKDALPFFKENITAIVQDAETCSLSYRSQVNGDGFEKLYRAERAKDVVLQRTTVGAHRDDYIFTLNGQPIKKFGSQGQQKSFLIALRLTQYDDLKLKTGKQPILLLDDVFDKLDDQRIARLVDLLNDDRRFGQIFLTDARKERSLSIFEEVSAKQVFAVEQGDIKQL